MFSTSQLSEGQKEALVKWAAEGATIADLQRGLKEEFAISATYMDTRFVVLDLGIEILEPEKEAKVADKGTAAGAEIPADDADLAGPGGVRVTVDELAVPGALVSGRVVFSDGEKAIWMLDQMGRPGLDPDTPGYRPGEADILEFQRKLREILSREGG